MAGAAEQLATSVRMIADRVAESTSATARVVNEVEGAGEKIQTLAQTIDQIGEVAQLISGIANQTNLLALNATIEAARAGEAGKGFAVVASEVKALAVQTAKATEEIAGKINEIQGSTIESVEAMRRIRETITTVTTIAGAIDQAVSEQRFATQEIARSAQDSANGATEISNHVVRIQHSSEGASNAATDLLGAASELSVRSNGLSATVSRFLAEVRAA